MPDLPTVAELGYPGFEVNVWYALFAPAKTPNGIIERIRAEAIKALQAADVQTQLDRAGVNIQTSTPAELGQRIRAETEVLAALIRELDLRVQ